MKPKLLEFIASLLPTIGRDDVAEDIRITCDEISKLVIPSYQDAETAAVLGTSRSNQAQRLTNGLVGRLVSIGTRRRTNWAGEVLVRMRNASINAELIAKLVDTELDTVVIAEGVSSRKAVLLRMAGVMSFASRYSLDLLNYILLLERAEVEGDHVLSSMVPIVRRRIESQVNYFADALNDIGIEPKEFADRFKDMQDVLVNQKNAQAVMGALDTRRFDPFGFTGAIMGFTWSPALVIGIPLANWQHSRYERAKENAAMLKTQLQIMAEENQRNPNPGLERAMKYHSDRLTKLEKQINDYEDDLRD